MGNLFSEEEKDDGYGHMATYGRYVRHMEAQRDYSSDDTRDGSYTQHGGQSYNRVSDSDDTGDDGRSQHAYVQSNNVVHYNEDELANRAIKALDRAAESSPVTGSEGRRMFLSLRGGREAVLALMEQWHPDLLSRMKLKDDGFPDARYHKFKMLMKVLGQYVPIFTKTSEAAARIALTSGCSEAAARALKKLDKKCRTYKVLAAAGIDFDKMSLSESQLMIKKLHYFGNDTRLTATLRLAHSVKWYNSLVDDEKPGGHVNALLVLSGLKNLKQRKRELQNECRRQEEEWERRRQEEEEYERRRRQEEELVRRWRQEEEDERRRQEEEDERRRQEEEDYERRRQEEYERELQEGEEYERYWRQEREYERQRQEEEDYERRRQEEEYERQRQEEEYEQRYYGTVVSIKKNHAHGNEYAFVEPGNKFLHPSDMRLGEWVDVGDEINYSIGCFNGRQKCVDVVITEYSD